jgi:hypothetical protein
VVVSQTRQGRHFAKNDVGSGQPPDVDLRKTFPPQRPPDLIQELLLDFPERLDELRRVLEG